MTAVGERPDLLDEDEDIENPGLWESFATALRLIVGWFCVIAGVLDLLVELDHGGGTPDGPYVFFHVTLLAGGIVLLAFAWIGPRPGVPGYVTGAAMLAGGMLISALPATSRACCMAEFPVRHGYPFTFLVGGDGRWHLDGWHALADLLFWGYLGLLALVVVALFRRDAGSGRDAGAAGASRDAREERPRRKTVGPLP
jgi:hypothetical protein